MAVILAAGRQNPHGDKTSPATTAETVNPATNRNPSRGSDSAHSDEAILTYQTLPLPGGTGGSVANRNSNAIAPPFGNNPDATKGAMNHP